MAVIHDTTLTPSKLELVTSWLPAQPWYQQTGREPKLSKVGGFRLDDPDGEVGIELMLVADGPPQPVAVYQVPLTYRAGPCATAEDGFIATAEHGVLGRRWIYDGTHDPVFVAQLVSLLRGAAEPQAQTRSNTPDPTVITRPVLSGRRVEIESVVATTGPDGTRLRVRTAGGTADLDVHIKRRLETQDESATLSGPRPACVTAPWRLSDGTRVRGVLATAAYTAMEASASG
jgi:Maltokinase N-terminal cap domain